MVIDCQSLTSHLVTQLRKTLLFRMKLRVFVSVLVSLIALGLCQGPGILSYEFCSVGKKCNKLILMYVCQVEEFQRGLGPVLIR